MEPSNIQKNNEDLLTPINTIETNSKNHIIKEKEEECIELRNLEYQTMLQNNKRNQVEVKNKTKKSQVKTLEDLDDLMAPSNKTNDNKPWNKLNKQGKIEKLHNYIDNVLQQEYELTEQEVKKMKLYIKTQIERKRLLKISEIEYDKEKGVIIGIPSLSFQKKTRKFTLKKSEKNTTLKKKSKTQNNKDNEN